MSDLPDAAIEAAAEAIRRTSRWIEDNYPEDAARAAIEAAMPAIAAQVLNDAADEIGDESEAAWLRARAKEEARP